MAFPDYFFELSLHFQEARTTQSNALLTDLSVCVLAAGVDQMGPLEHCKDFGFCSARDRKLRENFEPRTGLSWLPFLHDTLH